MMLIAKRNTMLGVGKSDSCVDFIPDGLLACWDGIENNGVGRHLPSNYLISDLVKSNSAILNPNQKVDFTNYGAFALSSTYSCRAYTTSDIADAINSRNITVVFCGHIKSAANGETQGILGAYNSSTNRPIQAYFVAVSSNSREALRASIGSAGSSMHGDNTNNIENDSDAIVILRFSKKEDGSIDFRFNVNGVESFGNFADQGALAVNTTSLQINGYNGSTSNHNDTYHIRIYGRTITDDEVNRLLIYCKSRFNLAIELPDGGGINV